MSNPTNFEIAQQERFRTLPRPTSLQAKKMLQRAVNRLVLKPTATASVRHSCIFCGREIAPGMVYRNAGVMVQSHEDCLQEISRRLK